MKILLSAPRAGSSYCYETFHNYNLGLPNVKYIGVEEYFDPNQLSHLTTLDKINFLIIEKNKGVHYTFKHHINYLEGYYKTWFVDFYKDDEIFILKRQDTWKWFLSFLFQDCVSWSSAAILKTDKFDESDVKNNWTTYDYKKSLTQFFKIKTLLDNCEGQIIYYENLNHASNKYIKLSGMVNYDKYFINLDDIKKEFKKYD